jgi:signal transduction histidine kinase
MRERVEMVGGHFSIESTPKTGTKIIVRIPITKSIEKKWQQESIKPKAKKP